MKRLGLVLLTTIGLGLWLTPIGGQQEPDPFSGAFVPGEIIVKFTRSVSQAQRRGFMAARGAAIVRRFDHLDLDHVRLGPGRDMNTALAELRSNPQVAYAQPNHVYRIGAATGPNDPLWLGGSLWGLQKIAAQPAWEAHSGGNGTVIVAAIDTGVLYTHQDLAANMWRNPGEIAGNSVDDDQNGYVDDVYGIDTVNHDSDPIDDNGHGTHTSGTIAAVGNNATGVTGVNWNARILACKFLNGSGSGSDAAAIECFNYIVALKERGQNIRVSNNSWGTLRSTSISQALKDAMDSAGEAGILNVCAAGNNAANTDVTPYDPASFASSSIVSVAASDQFDNKAAFSNYGVTSVDLAAPGVDILSTVKNGGYDYESGTSMAAPHVAGAAALLASLDPTLSVDALKETLLQNVDVVPAWSGFVASGGRLNVHNAATAVPTVGLTSAVFAGLDTTTQGNWTNGYGGAGYSIVSDVTNLPLYASVTPSGHESWTWAASTSDGRALTRGVAPGRVAATWHRDTAFDITVGLTDGEPHLVAFYCVDYDSLGRTQRLEVFDAATNTLLDTQTISNFSGGVYLAWTVTSSIRVRVTRVGGLNAVVSGVFIGPSLSGNQPPAVSITSPSAGAMFALGSGIPITASAGDLEGPVASVAFYAGAQLLHTDTSAPYAFTWATAPVGAHTLTAVATDGESQSATSAPIPISVAAPASAVFAGFDTTTQGNWTNGYGGAGYSIVSDVTSLPPYASVTPSGHESWTWAASTSDGRALTRGMAPGRVAATWHRDTAFDIAVGLTDGEPHLVAFYCVDYDSLGRTQRLEVFDAATNTLLDTQTVTNFSGGVYLAWTVTSSIRVRVTRIGGMNAVVSGVFIGPSLSDNQPPTISITSPSAGATFALGSGIPLAATADDPDGTVASVAFYANGQLLHTDMSAPYAFNWATAPVGTHTLTAVATDGESQPATSAPIMISVAAPGGASAVFAGFDTTTQGNWTNGYGGAGYSIVSDVTNLPLYASVTPSGHESWTWAASTSDGRALTRGVAPGRVAATWHRDTAFDITVGLTDGEPHLVAFYCVDYDSLGRTQRLEVFDAATNTLLDTQTISNFSGGVYLAWTVTSSIRVRVTRVGGLNAVVSGVFIGPSLSGNQPPAVSITSPSAGAMFALGSGIPITASAGDLEGPVASVAFYAGAQLLHTDTSAPYAFTWATAPVGAHTLTAVATDGESQSATSAPIPISVAAPASAVFAGFDTTTQGDWTNGYGGAGYSIVSDVTSLPPYASVTPSGHESWTWAASTSDGRALTRGVAPGRVAATWHRDTAFDIAVGLTDGEPHLVAFYCVDYDSLGRTQRLEVFDAATNTLLDTQTVTNFSGGVYLAWTVTSSVRVRVTRIGGMNAIVSGVFIGAGVPASQPPAVTPSTITLRTDLVGTVPAGGNATSPIAAGPHLLLLNQTGSLYRWDGAVAQPILTAASAPAGVTPISGEAMLNVAADASGTSVFVMFTSSSVPIGVPQHASPRPGADAWQVLYRYNFNGTALSNAQPIVALQVRSTGHTGGGMVTLDDGTVLFATGDNGDAFEDGREYAQDAANHLSKILRINPTTASVTVVGIGVRNVQRLFVNPNTGDPRLEFVDLGGAIAEEFNSVRIANLLAAPAENFGWGRNAVDHLAREGTFYIEPSGAVAGVAPVPEAGFTQPTAQFGREGAPLVGVTGPVSSVLSFTSITSLVGDLPTGKVFAVTGTPGTPGQIVYAVNLVDGSLAPITLSGLAGGRPDPRFFLFPDGTAGVLLERTGAFYRLTQIAQ